MQHKHKYKLLPSRWNFYVFKCSVPDCLKFSYIPKAGLKAKLQTPSIPSVPQLTHNDIMQLIGTAGTVTAEEFRKHYDAAYSRMSKLTTPEPLYIPWDFALYTRRRWYQKVWDSVKSFLSIR